MAAVELIARIFGGIEPQQVCIFYFLPTITYII